MAKTTNRVCTKATGWLAVFCLVFTLANPSGIAHAQGKHMLLVEHLEKAHRTKILLEGDVITLHSAKTGNRHRGAITAFSDSSVTLGKTGFLLHDITFIEGKGKVKTTQKAVGIALIPVVVVLSGLGLALIDYEGVRDSMPLSLIGPATGMYAVYLLTHKPTQPFGPETGWRLRIKRTESAS